MATMEVKAMKKQLVGFLRSAVLVMAVMFNLLVIGCAVDESNDTSAVVAEEMTDQVAKCVCSGDKCVFDGIEECDGACTDEGCKSFDEMFNITVELAGPEDFAVVEVVDEPVSDGTFEIARNALELADFDLKQNCGGKAGPLGLSWCGDATYEGAPYDGRWSVIALIDSKGKCTMMAVKNSCDDAAELCVLDGVYPTYGVCKVPPLCKVDADCGLCTSCVGGSCKPVAKDTACEDGHKCTLNDACDGFGSCVSGVSKLCDDQNPCTVDVCDVATGDCATTNFPDNAVCASGDKCILGETCQVGKCVGTAVVCDDGNPCTTDSCDALTGNCKAVPVADSTKCEDEDPCTVEDACLAGVCEGKDKDCNDNNPCSADFCNPATGTCFYDALDDGTQCLGGVCVLGLCTPDGLWCEAGDPPCRQLGGELGYWECDVLQGSTFGLWSELQHCGPISQAVCIDGLGCTKPGAKEIACANGLDDDNDTFVDCLDPDCVGMPACVPPIPPETHCANGLDDDGDGLVDCMDQDCFQAPACQQQPPVPPAPVLSIRYGGYPNPTTDDTEVYLWCWGTGPGGNSPMGWTGLTYSANCVNPAPGADYCAEITGGQILVNWYTADGTVLGCVSNLREKSTAKWVPGCDNQSCTPMYNPGPTIAYITYAPGGADQEDMLAVDNGVGGKHWEWTK